MIERQITGRFVNAVVNDPSIRPWVCGPIVGPLDFGPLIESGQVIALFGIYGGFLFSHLEDGIYEGHVSILPPGRGKWALKAARAAGDWIVAYGAKELMMAVPHGNNAVRGLVRLLGGKKRGTIKNGWIINGHTVDVDAYSLLKDEWTCRTAV